MATEVVNPQTEKIRGRDIPLVKLVMDGESQVVIQDTILAAIGQKIQVIIDKKIESVKQEELNQFLKNNHKKFVDEIDKIHDRDIENFIKSG